MNPRPSLARPEDAAAIRSLQDEARAWLQARGSDQWSTIRHTDPASPRSLEAGIDRGEVWVWRDRSGIVATATLDDGADPELWTADDTPDDALYLHRMIVSRAAAGNHLGATIIDWAAHRAADLGRHWVRLDAWRSSTGLHAYYLRQGFQHVRTVDLPHRGSGALFQRRAYYPAGTRLDTFMKTAFIVGISLTALGYIALLVAFSVSDWT